MNLRFDQKVIDGPKGPVDTNWALHMVMAYRQTHDMGAEPMLVKLIAAYISH